MDAEDRRHRQVVRLTKVGVWIAGGSLVVALIAWLWPKTPAPEQASAPPVASTVRTPSPPPSSASSPSPAPAASTLQVSATPTGSGYVEKYSGKTLDFPPTLASNNQAADLDIPAVNYVENIDSDDQDIRVEYATGVRGGFSGSFGTTTAQDPTPNQCVGDAMERAAGTVEYKDLVPGKTIFCVITTEGNVAWMKLIRMKENDGSQAHLTFTVRLWTMHAM